MGLDQYAFIVRKHEKNTDFSVYWLGEEVPDSIRDKNFASIAEWRKHPYLQGWMENLFNKKADAQGFEGKTAPGGMYTDISINFLSPDGSEELNEELTSKIRTVSEEISKSFKEVVKDAAPERMFNNQPLRLTLSDLEQLETAISRGELPESSGFFWGEDSSDYYKESDLEFIREARQTIINGNEVYYDSSW